MCAANTKASMHKHSFTTHCHWELTSHVPVGEDTDERIPMQADGAKGAVVARVERTGRTCSRARCRVGQANTGSCAQFQFAKIKLFGVRHLIINMGCGVKCHLTQRD